MKDKADLVRGWLRKAASDVVSMEATLKAGSLDGACFHAQQAAEKYLKGAIYEKKGGQLGLFEDEEQEALDLNEAEEMMRQLRGESCRV